MDAAANSAITLSDVIGRDRSINIFASFTRDIAPVAARLDSPAHNTTVLAPLNVAVTALPRKPWEDPADYARLGAAAYDGSGGSERANENLQRFVEAHVVPVSPWEEGVKVKTLGGGEVWWGRNGEGEKVVQPGGVLVESVPSKVGNGEVWIIKEVLNYAS